VASLISNALYGLLSIFSYSEMICGNESIK